MSLSTPHRTAAVWPGVRDALSLTSALANLDIKVGA